MDKAFSQIIFIILLLISSASLAVDLTIPLRCKYGKECFISSYYDKDPEADLVADYTCGNLSNDNYKSTDFILKHSDIMSNGVDVIAADMGEVSHIRDGMSDVTVDLIGFEAIRGRECGNGIIIKHKRGFETEYCHLKKNSISVQEGNIVQKGEKIAELGLSGNTTFPYLQFTVSLNTKRLDPFTGDNLVTGEPNVLCDNLDFYPLWDRKSQRKLKYITTTLMSAGFSDNVPYARGAREGKFTEKTISNKSNIIAFWLDIFGIQNGDILQIKLLDPSGKIIKSETKKFKKDIFHSFHFIGEKRGKNLWAKGKYKGIIELIRKNDEESFNVISEKFYIVVE